MILAPFFAYMRLMIFCKRPEKGHLSPEQKRAITYPGLSAYLESFFVSKLLVHAQLLMYSYYNLP